VNEWSHDITQHMMLLMLVQKQYPTNISFTMKILQGKISRKLV